MMCWGGAGGFLLLALCLHPISLKGGAGPDAHPYEALGWMCWGPEEHNKGSAALDCGGALSAVSLVCMWALYPWCPRSLLFLG